MKLLGKPQNRWGWARTAGWAVCAVILLWTVLAVVLRGMGEVTWMAWSSYQNFSLLDGLELAVGPLLAAFIFGWLEEHDARVEGEQARHRESERALAEQRKETLMRVHEAVHVELQGEKHIHGDAELPAPARLQINQAVRAALLELDGKGKGELLHFCHETGLLAGEKSILDWHGADLSGAALHKPHLEGANLSGADLSGAQFNGAHLARAKLGVATLSKAFLRHADLREAVMAGCNLSGARLENATLAGADLREARLDGAFLMNANLKDARFDGSFDLAVLIDTILPDGQKVTNAKGKEYLQKKEIATLVDRL